MREKNAYLYPVRLTPFAFMVERDGAWTRYGYDAEGRKTLEVTPWLDAAPGTAAAQAVAKTFDYAPVDPRDSAGDYDNRPRRIVEKTLGIETSRTYYAYFTDAGGEFVEIEERATEQGAAYGAASGLRTTRRHYAPDAVPAERAGRLKSETLPDGTVRAHDYAATAEGGLETTVARLALQGGVPQPVDGKSTRVITERDARGNRVAETTEVYVGGAWAPVRAETRTYSPEIGARGFRLLEHRVEGRPVLEQSWSGPLVVERVGESGTVRALFYDPLDRVEMEIKFGVGGRPDIVTEHDRSLGALGCGCDGERVTTRTAGGLTLTASRKTDAAGRVSETVGENGYTTTYAYAEDGRVETRTDPDGGTRVAKRYRDGRPKSVTGTGVIDEFHTHTVNPDGTRTTRTETASQGSPRYRETTVDPAGRMIREASPDFTGGTFLREMHYNDRGLLAKQTETGRADTLFEYDALADLVRSGPDIDGDGSLAPASSDRITDTDTVHEQDGAGDWFAVTTTEVYPEAGSAATVAVSVEKRRLGGFGTDPALGELAAETVSVDVHGNATVRRRYIDRAAATVTRITDTPGSDTDARSVTVNGLLTERNTATVAAPTVFGYDAIERRISVKDPRHTAPSSISYLPSTNQVITQTDADGNTTAFEYHGQGAAGAGQIKTVTDALGQKSYRAYDLLDREIRTWGETDYPQEYTYNAFGELATLTTWRDADDSIDFSGASWPAEAESEGGDTTTWTYDPATGLLTRKEYADGNGTDYSYDSANRLHIRTWARSGGLDTTYGYDPDTGELLTVDYEDAATADITHTYDRLGRRATVTDATGTRSFDYDAATLQLDTETLDGTFYDGMVLTRAYEDGTQPNGLPGRDAGHTLGGTPSPVSAAYGYDTAGRLKTVSDGTDTLAYTYEPDSNLLATIEGPVHAVAYDYEDNRDVMTGIDNRATDLQGATLSRYGYTYDALGRRDDRTQSGSAINTASTDDFAYNPRSEMVGSTNSVETAAAWNPTYTFDKIGNRIWSVGVSPNAYTTNELNQYTAVDSTNPTYDADGNLTSDGNWTYTWNGENRLASATDGNVLLEFTYDYQGRLVRQIEKTENQTTGNWETDVEV